MLREAFQRGVRDGLRKLGLAQPSLGSVGITTPVKAPGLPSPTKTPSLSKPSLKLDAGLNAPATSLGIQAAKVAFNVGMGASTPRHEGPGAVRGEPADEGRRQQSVVDRAFQRNEDDYATSSMPLPGAGVSP